MRVAALRMHSAIDAVLMPPPPSPVAQEGIVKAAAYFRSLDLGRFKKPTKHTAHQNTEMLESQAKKKQKTV